MNTPVKCILGLIFVLGLLFGILAFGSPQWKWCYILQDAMGWKPLSDIPEHFTGTLRTYRLNGSIDIKCQCVDGKLHGNFISYYENGKVMATTNYVDGKEHGNFKMYDLKGRLSQINVYRQDEVIEYQVYDPAGWLKLKKIPDKSYSGEMQYQYFKDGSLQWIKKITDKGLFKGNIEDLVYSKAKKIDRRQEFGLALK